MQNVLFETELFVPKCIMVHVGKTCFHLFFLSAACVSGLRGRFPVMAQ